MKHYKLLFYFLFIVLIFLLNYCKADPCDVISVSSSGNLNVDCKGGSTTVSNAKYSGYGELISYNFSVTCDNGNIYTGYVTVRWESHRAVSSSLTVNGKSCN